MIKLLEKVCAYRPVFGKPNQLDLDQVEARRLHLDGVGCTQPGCETITEYRDAGNLGLRFVVKSENPPALTQQLENLGFRSNS